MAQSVLWLASCAAIIVANVGCDAEGCYGLDFEVFVAVPMALLLAGPIVVTAELGWTARQLVMWLEVLFLAIAALLLSGLVNALVQRFATDAMEVAVNVVALPLVILLATVVIVQLRRARPIFTEARAARPNRQLARTFGVVLGGSSASGRVTDVATGSAAESAGIKPGDLITSVNGHDVNSVTRLVWAMITAGRAGTDIALSVSDPAGASRQVVVRRARR